MVQKDDLKNTLGIPTQSTIHDVLLQELLDTARAIVALHIAAAVDESDVLHRRIVLLEAAALWYERQPMSEKERYDGHAREMVYRALELRRLNAMKTEE